MLIIGCLKCLEVNLIFHALRCNKIVRIQAKDFPGTITRAMNWNRDRGMVAIKNDMDIRTDSINARTKIYCVQCTLSIQFFGDLCTDNGTPGITGFSSIHKNSETFKNKECSLDVKIST